MPPSLLHGSVIWYVYAVPHSGHIRNICNRKNIVYRPQEAGSYPEKHPTAGYVPDRTLFYQKESLTYLSYFTGGAHPNYEIKTINYNKNTNKFIDIDDLINRDKDILNKLSIYSREYFSNNDMFNDKVVFDMMIDGTKSIKDNYKYFNITSDGLIIYFNRYQIAPYYYGDYSITIPYNYLDLSI